MIAQEPDPSPTKALVFSDIIGAIDMKGFAEMQVMVLTTQLNFWRKQLGYNPKRCPHCGKTLKAD